MSKRKKALFVTHDVSLYGASRSLQTLLTNLEDVDVDLVVKKRLKGKWDLNEINAFFNKKAKLIKEFHLPHPGIYKGSEWKDYRIKLNDLLWKSNSKAFYKFIQANDYDFIHLNSIVLHQLIRKELPAFIHIREIFNGSQTSVFDSLRNARGVIFIDEATEEPFKDLKLQNSTILNNPFDMRHLHEVVNSDLIQKHSLEGKTVFSIIGSVAPVKGVELAIRAFKEVKCENAVLLIVGKSNNEAYIKLCKELAGNDLRIIFYGEEADIGKIYAMSDYIIRCDPQFCVGRTVYEGLYAGCHVILPGHEHNREALFDLDRFTDSITLYPPQDTDILAKVIEKKSHQKIFDRNFSTNIPSHLQQFNQFISEKL
ncbi:glycosyltransferase [Pontibacter pamirensis]|uniref:glycosyltransferase n=1 Tax=Pontibacter pamirensis TaxID=2562824 RepID=UPI0013897C0F|nr:glycosyltransferase [Pontibacter pamirensis]